MALDLLAHVRSESARFRAALTDVDPAARVPSCPDWNAADLLWHLAEVQHFWGVIVRDKLDDPEQSEADQPERAEDYQRLLAQFDEAHTILVEALDGTADDVPVWTWFEPDRSVGFVRRRQAHEALIHRVDAELTAAAVTGIDPALANDGVLEVLEWMYAGVPEWASSELTGPVGRIATTDAGDSWLVRIGSWSGHSPNTGKTYDAEPFLVVVDSGEPEFRVTGRAADLDCWLWNRPAGGEITTEGDVATFMDVIRSGVQ
jgi:uncharacterized protein (TIGR03083 family)